MEPNMADVELRDLGREGHHVAIEEPPETEALRPVQMRDKPSGRDRKAPRVSLVARAPDTPRHSTMPVQESPAFWTRLNLHAYIQKRRVHPLAWVMFGFLVLALLLVVITFGAPGWALTKEIRQIDGWFEGEMQGNYGLWYACWSLLEHEEYTITSCELMADLHRVPSWFKGVQAVGALSLFSSVAGMAATCAYICSKIQNERPVVLYAVMIFCTAAGICVGIECAVFCVLFIHDAKWCCNQQAQVVEWRLQYCFFFACLAALCLWGAALTALFENRRLRNNQKQEQYLEKLRTSKMDEFGHGMDLYRGY